MPDIGGALTRKIGPLPAWGWGVAVGGAFLAVNKLGGGEKKPAPQVVQTEYDDSFGPTVGFQEGLSNQLFDVRQQLDELTNIVSRGNEAPQVNQPVTNPVKAQIRRLKVEIFGRNLVFGGAKGLAERYPGVYRAYQKRRGTLAQQDTPAERAAYLRRLSRLLNERDDRVSAK